MNDTANILFDPEELPVLEFVVPSGWPASPVSIEIFENEDSDDADIASSVISLSPTGGWSNYVDDSGDGRDNPRELRQLYDASGPELGEPIVILTSTSAAREWVEPSSVNSINTATSREALKNFYTSGAQIVSPSYAYPFLLSFLRNASNISATLSPRPRYRCAWKYTTGEPTPLSSYTRRMATYFDVVRYIPSHSVTGLDVDAFHPGWLASLWYSDRVDNGTRTIREAWRHVKMDLYQQLKNETMARNRELLNELVILAAVWLEKRRHSVMGFGGERDYEVARTLYQSRIREISSAFNAIPYAVEASGGARHVGSLTPFVR